MILFKISLSLWGEIFILALDNNISMYNWSVDEKKFKKNYPKEYRLWRITQLINYGLEEGEKLDSEEVKRNWNKIVNDLDPNKSLYIKYLLWGQKPSSNQFIENF